MESLFGIRGKAWLPSAAQKILAGQALEATDFPNLPILSCSGTKLAAETHQTYVTPLHLAAELGKTAVCQYLLKQGADRNWMHIHQGRTAAFYALTGPAKPDLQNEVFKLLISHPDTADLLLSDVDGYGLAHICMIQERIHELESLLLVLGDGEPSTQFLDHLFAADALAILADKSYREDAARISRVNVKSGVWDG